MMQLTVRPGETATFGVNWKPRQLVGDSITTSVWRLPADLTEVDSWTTGPQTALLLSGFRAGVRYTLLNRITTSSGRVLEEPVQIEVTSRTAPLISAAEVRETYLNNLPLYDAEGDPVPDYVLERRIARLERAFERRFGVRLTPTAIKVGSRPLAGELKPGDVLDDDPARYEPLLIERVETFPGINYSGEGNLDSRHHSMYFPVGPVREVVSFGLWLPSMKEPARFSNQWVHTTKRSHRAQVYPGSDLTMPVLYTTLPAATLLPGGRTVPQAWHASYIAGYRDSDFADQDMDVLDGLGKFLALELLLPGSIDKNLSAGITNRSASVDGLSQSVGLLNNANALKFQPLINAYKEAMDDFAKTFFTRKGIRLGAV